MNITVSPYAPLAALVRPAKRPTVADLVEFVKAHPADPCPHIGLWLIIAKVKEDEPLDVVERRLSRALNIARAQIKNRHWAANHTRVSVIEKLIGLVDEFQSGGR